MAGWYLDLLGVLGRDTAANVQVPPSALRASAASRNRRLDTVACPLDLQFRRETMSVGDWCADSAP